MTLSYTEDACEKIVASRGYCAALYQKYGSTNFSSKISSALVEIFTTPREECVRTPVVPMCSFYYLEYLLENKPAKIVDIGCGINFFKGILPCEVHGIDTKGTYQDQTAFFDNVFVKNNTNAFESVFSINAIHFRPLSFVGRVVKNFYSVIKPGGRGYLALNTRRMIDQAPEFEQCSNKEVENYIREELEKTKIKFLVFDCLVDLVPDESMDGNVRLVMEKPV